MCDLALHALRSGDAGDVAVPPAIEGWSQGWRLWPLEAAARVPTGVGRTEMEGGEHFLLVRGSPLREEEKLLRLFKDLPQLVVELSLGPPHPRLRC